MADDGDVLEAPERALGQLEGRRRDVDQVHRHRAPAQAQRLGDHGELLAAAAAELRDRHRIADRTHHLRREPRQEAALRPRDPVPRQVADRFEERRAEAVVEVLRLELFGGQGQVAADFFREIAHRFGGRRLRGERDRHYAAVRNFAYT